MGDEARIGCGACHWSSIVVAGDDGDVPMLQCRRHSPTVQHVDDGEWTMWPQVDADDWCGEFSP